MGLRGILIIIDDRLNNTLTSTATNKALTAAQGKVLNDMVTNWTTAQTLAEGATSVTFTGLNADYAYDLYGCTVCGWIYFFLGSH